MEVDGTHTFCFMFQPHFTMHNFYQEVGGKLKIEKNPNKRNMFSSSKMLLDVQ